MAQIHLQPPGNFDFKNPDGWQLLRKRFEQFRIASGLGEATGQRQVSTLLYWDAEPVLNSIDITGGERMCIANTVLKKFDSFFSVRKNTYLKEQDLIATTGNCRTV